MRKKKKMNSDNFLIFSYCPSTKAVFDLYNNEKLEYSRQLWERRFLKYNVQKAWLVTKTFEEINY